MVERLQFSVSNMSLIMQSYFSHIIRHKQHGKGTSAKLNPGGRGVGNIVNIPQSTSGGGKYAVATSQLHGMYLRVEHMTIYQHFGKLLEQCVPSALISKNLGTRLMSTANCNPQVYAFMCHFMGKCMPSCVISWAQMFIFSGGHGQTLFVIAGDVD